MPYTMEDFQREVKEEFLGSLTGEELDRFLNSLKPEDRLKGLKPEDVLKKFKPEEIEEYLEKTKRDTRT